MPTVEIDGIPLHYEERGDRRRPTIVLLHPILFGQEVFDDLVPIWFATSMSSAPTSTAMGAAAIGRSSPST